MIAVPGIGDGFPRVLSGAKWKGDSVANVSRLQNLLGGERSTVRRGEAWCFRVMTIRGTT